MATVAPHGAKTVGTAPSLAATAALIYAVFICALACLRMSLTNLGAEASGNYWGTSRNVFDGSEPNNVIAPWVSEFWSASTDLPFAGVHLLLLAARYGYDWRLVFVYCIVVMMYATACVGHVTMNIPVCQAAIVMVISTPIVTFLFWGALMGAPFGSALVRGAVAGAGWVLLVAGIYTLPFVLAPLGGLFTVFVVQTPPIIASLLGALRVEQLHGPGVEALQKGVSCLKWAGVLLVAAMVILLGEVHFCATECAIAGLKGLPWVHLVVHALQQVAVYLFGVGSACVHYTVFEPQPCSLQWRGFVPYLALIGEKVAQE